MDPTMQLALALVLVWVGGFAIGVFSLLFYILLRMMRNDGWDDSNLTNALRLLSHVVLHGEDFGRMVYQGTDKKPFWYISGDEFADVVKTRPPQK